MVLLWKFNESTIACFVMLNVVIALTFDSAATYASQKLIRDDYRVNANEMLIPLFSLAMLFAVVYIFVFYKNTTLNLTLFSIYLILNAVFIKIRVYLQVNMRFNMLALLNALRYLGILLGVSLSYFISTLFEEKVEVFIFVNTCLFCLLLFFVIFYKNIIVKNYKPKVCNITGIFSNKDRYVVVYILLLAGWGQFDVIIANSFLDEYFLVVVSNSLRLSAIFVLIISSINTVLLPHIKIKEFEVNSRNRYILSILIILLFLVSYFSSEYLIPIYTGGNYLETIIFFKISLFGLVTSFFVLKAFNHFVAFGKQNILVRSLIMSFSFKVILLYTLTYYEVYAFKAIAISYSLSLIFFNFLVLKEFKRSEYITSNV
jgi:O-antigen/teichoic acid export membrane protein